MLPPFALGRVSADGRVAAIDQLRNVTWLASWRLKSLQRRFSAARIPAS